MYKLSCQEKSKVVGCQVESKVVGLTSLAGAI